MANVPYVQACSEVNQLITAADTPQIILLDCVDDTNEFTVDSATGEITYIKQGVGRKFDYTVSPQVGRTDVCQDEIPNFRIWLQIKRKNELNFSNVENNNVLLNVNRHRTTKDVIVLQGLITLNSGDKIRLMMASNVSNSVQLEYIDMGANEPAVPSITTSITYIGEEPIII